MESLFGAIKASPSAKPEVLENNSVRGILLKAAHSTQENKKIESVFEKAEVLERSDLAYFKDKGQQTYHVSWTQGDVKETSLHLVWIV